VRTFASAAFNQVAWQFGRGWPRDAIALYLRFEGLF